MHVPTDAPAGMPPRASSSSAPAALPPDLRRFLLWLSLATFLSFADAFLRWPLQGRHLAFAALHPAGALVDLDCFWLRFNAFRTPAFFANLHGNQVWTYPAPCALLYWLIYRVSTHLTFVGTDLLFNLPGLLVACVLFVAALHRAGLARRAAGSFVAICTLASWPIYFCLERGNIEATLWLMLAAALAFYVRGRTLAAAVLLGLATAFKLYPVLLFGLYLPARRLRELLVGLVTAAGSTLGGLLFLSPHHPAAAAHFVLDGLHRFVALYSVPDLGVTGGYDHSAWTLVKLPLRHHPALLQRGLPLYFCGAAVFAAALYLTRLWRAPRFNQVLALCTLMVLLPSTSFDYTLQTLYIPFAWLCLLVVQADRDGRTIPSAPPFFACFALLFGPLTFVRSLEITVSGQVKALVLLVLLYLAARLPVEAPFAPKSADGLTQKFGRSAFAPETGSDA